MIKRFFILLLAIVASVGMSWAATVVTITEADFPTDGSQSSFTKDGVTITTGSSFDDTHNLWYPTFTSSVGNFTKIEISAGDVALTGEGWSDGNTWTGNASSVSTDGDSHVFVFYGSVTITCTIAPAAPAYETVMNLINAIGTVELTAECKAKIDAARETFDALSTEDQALVTNIATLTQAETDYAALAAAAAAPVIAQIEALPTTIKLSTYFSTYDLMVTARAAYNALSAEVQAAVTNLSKLTNLEAAFAAIGGANEKLSKPFSVGEGQVVYFAHGNLQATYNGTNWSWAFAAHQYEYIGDASGNIIINGNGTLSGAGTVDLFGWVANSSTVLTSGVAKYGVSNSDNVSDYGLGTTETLKGDWGVAANDANIGGYNDWRILSNDEWVYLFKTRTDAASKYGYATVGGVNGVIIIPDAFTDPMKNKGNLAFRPQNVDKGYSTNVYTTGGDWEAMEAAGAVFMPAAGRRYGTTMTVNEGTGFYWSSTPMSYQASYFMGFMGSNVVPNNDRYRSHGLSVRLVSNNAPVASTPLDSALVVKDMIEAIPAEITLEDACVKAINDAREAYNKLSEAAKGLIDEATLAKLTDAEAALTATAEDKTVTYGDAAPEYTVVYAGWHGTDDASVLTGAIAYACDYLPTSNVGEYTITPSGVDAANYSITFVNGKVTVAKADLMITADDKNVTYGDAVPEYTATYNGWKNTDDASVVSGLIYTCEYAPTSNVGEYTITPSGATATNYNISFTNGKVTVSKATLTITAENKEMIYGDEHPEFTVTYSGWINGDDESMVSGLQFSTPYAPGSPIGTYAINPNSATALNYAIIFVDGTLTVNKAHVYVSDAEAQIAKFADGHANAVVLKQGVLNGIKLNDPIAHVTTAAFSSADVAEHLTITLFYELTGDAALLNNYNLDPTSDIFTNEGVIIEPFIPDNEEKPEDKEATVNEGIEIYAYGYCDGSGYSLKYHLESGNPDQYKIEFEDSRFTDVDWTNLTTVGKDGTIDIEIPVDMPTGDYTMTVYFRDSRFDWLESRKLNVTFHVNLPETYVRPLFDNVIALVDTCGCLTDIQWYWRANSTDLWQPIEGANGYYYHADGKLTGEYFVSAKMNGEPTYTCGQTDMETLYGADKNEQAAIVKAYPNPVITTTKVTIENSDSFNHNLRVVNLMGVEVMNTSFEGNETQVDMYAYPQGNYMITVDGIVVKVMKQ